MDLRRLRAGEMIAAAAGAVTLVSLFVPWYDAEPGPAASSTRGWTSYAPIDLASTLSGWESLAVIDVVLALIAVAAILLAAVTAAQSVPAVPIAYSALVTLAGMIGCGLVLYRALDLPDGVAGRDWGLWLGLAGTAAIAAGGALAMRDERLSPPGRPLDLTGRPAPPAPALEPIPAPRTEDGS